MQNAQQSISKPFDASKWRIGIVVAQFNRHITDASLKSALAASAEYKIPSDNIDIVKVAGSVEIPLALQKMAITGKYDALLALGCIIQGETPHFDYVAKFVTEGVLRVQLDHKVVIGFGVLTCENEKQAVARTGLGGDHLAAALQLAKAIE